MEKQHTFGGSHLDRFLIDYEVSEADVLGAAPAMETAPAVESPLEAAPAPAADSWAPSRDEWEQSQQFQQAIMEALQDDSGGIPTPADAPDLSTPEAAQRFIDEIATQKAESIYQERFGPYQPLIEDFAKERGKAMVTSELDKIANGDEVAGTEGIGEFDKTYAAELAHSYFAQGVPADRAIRAAAERTRALEQAALARGAAAERGQMQNRVDAPHTPAAGGAAADTPQSPLTGRDRYEQLANDWVNRRTTTTPVG